MTNRLILPPIGFPAQAGTHMSVYGATAQWIPACAGMVIKTQFDDSP